MSVTILFWLGLVVLAVVLLWRNVRGRRVGDEPRCKGCEYNLTGLESNRCPECGATLRDDLDQPIGVVNGRLQRAPVRVTLAVVLLLAAGTMLASNIAQMKVNWLRFAPTGWVTSSAESGTRNAMDELVRRYNAQALSAEQITEVIDAGLKIQSAPTAHVLLAEWMNLLGAILSGGDMTVEQETSFIKNSAIFALTPRPKIRSGKQLPIKLSHKGRFADAPQISMQLSEKDVRIGDMVFSARRGEFASFGFAGTGGGGSVTLQVREPVDLPPGEYEVALTVHRKVFVGSPQRPATAPPDYEFDDVFRAPVTILPADADSPVKTTADPDLEPEIRNCISVDELKLDLSQATYRHLDCDIAFGGPAVKMPIDLAFHIIVKAGRFEQDIGSVHCAKGGETNFGTGMQLDGTGMQLDDEVEFIDDLVNAETVTVILRTDMEAAHRTVDLMNVWDGEIQFDDVQLTVVNPTP